MSRSSKRMKTEKEYIKRLEKEYLNKISWYLEKLIEKKLGIEYTNLKCQFLYYDRRGGCRAIITRKSLFGRRSCEDDLFISLCYKGSGIYCPIVDISIAPFNLSKDRNLKKIFIKLCNNIDNELGYISSLIKKYYEKNVEKVIRDLEKILKNPGYEEYRNFDFADIVANIHPLNRNPRCFIAIEVELSRRPRKYLLGSIVNASLFGYYGIVVTSNVDVALRLRTYLMLLQYTKQEVDPRQAVSSNVIVLSEEQFKKFLEELRENLRRKLEKLD